VSLLIAVVAVGTSSVAILRGGALPRWLGYCGLAVTFARLVLEITQIVSGVYVEGPRNIVFFAFLIWRSVRRASCWCRRFADHQSAGRRYDDPGPDPVAAVKSGQQRRAVVTAASPLLRRWASGWCSERPARVGGCEHRPDRS
jgi:hypothetical protein